MFRAFASRVKKWRERADNEDLIKEGSEAEASLPPTPGIPEDGGPTQAPSPNPGRYAPVPCDEMQVFVQAMSGTTIMLTVRPVDGIETVLLGTEQNSGFPWESWC
jgi:hypothetical protein